MLPSLWTPIFEYPAQSIRVKYSGHKGEITLSLICSALPKKSARQSVTRPVTRRDVKSNIPFGSSSVKIKSARLSESRQCIWMGLTIELVLLL